MVAIIEFRGISGTGAEILKNWITEQVAGDDDESMLRYATSVRFEENVKKADWNNCDGM